MKTFIALFDFHHVFFIFFSSFWLGLFACFFFFCQHPPLVSFAAARAGSDSPNSPTPPPPSPARVAAKEAIPASIKNQVIHP